MKEPWVEWLVPACQATLLEKTDPDGSADFAERASPAASEVLTQIRTQPIWQLHSWQTALPSAASVAATWGACLCGCK